MIGAAVMAALAVLLGLSPSGPQRLRRLDASDLTPHRRGGRRRSALTVTAVVTAVVGTWMVPGLAAVFVASGTIGWIARSRRRRRRAARAVEDVAEGATLLAALLRTGQVPSIALREAAHDCEALEFAAAVSALGGDVGNALAQSSTEPGRSQLAAVAAAWTLGGRSGAPTAELLAGVAENLRHRQALGSLVESELAAARASGHIMAALPFLGLGLGAVVGADPLSFLLHDPGGSWAILIAVGLTSIGVLWIERLAAGAERTRT